MNINIKINRTLMVAVLLLTFSIVGEAAEFSIGNYTVNKDEQITSQIELKDVTNFGTATISLLYNPSVVQVTTVSNGNIPTTTMTNNIGFPINGSTRILVFTSDVPGPNGNFIFSNISLKAVGNEGSQSSLSITIQEFADNNGSLINYTILNGTFSIKPSGISNVSSISGLKFNDSNSNSIRDTGEEGIANWEIKLLMPDGNTSTTVTDANGSYIFNGLVAGNYTVEEVLKPNWTQTVPAGKYSIILPAGQNVTSKDFGNVMNVTPTPETRRVIEIIDNMSGVPLINQSTMDILAEDFINFNPGDRYNITISRVTGGTVEFNTSGTLQGLDKETIKVDWIPQTQGAYILRSDANTTTEARIVQVINQKVISPVPELSTIALVSAGLLGLFGLARRRNNS